MGKLENWKDHFKNDLRSDQDHRLKIDLRSRLKQNMMLQSSQSAKKNDL
jgi:hypothetical protein